ncbi:TadE family type IV pilus minor pilin [Streptomonospora wellingtoniae]|uniref:TadE family type IV pilus minor pilin n=1 Tax=Streptomonospora wellingtoniae TaxID=3075544 RepID=A0ABU2KXT3_9ACTN|nr:TadE family type IV pilus minor pilin [Streptomonospora sp. DSM 45055]MDT0304031.1 TadE family type IV pilus minor pilin [Streptomonospora sp. DSM 45055]
MRCRSTDERGGVTAETAAALPSLVLMLGVALAAVQAGAVHVACVDSARTGARALARGETGHAVRAAVDRIAPDSARVELATGGGMARVTVTAPVPIGPLADLPIEVEGVAATPLESLEPSKELESLGGLEGPMVPGHGEAAVEGRGSGQEALDGQGAGEPEESEAAESGGAAAAPGPCPAECRAGP